MPFLKKNSVKLLSIFSISISFVLAVTVLYYINQEGSFIYNVGHFGAPVGIEIFIGNIEGVLGVVFLFTALATVWYSIYSIDKEIELGKIRFYYLLINILIASLLGMTYSNDIFNSFVFIEISTLASCGIIVIKDKKENIKATIKYLIVSCLGSGLFLMATAFLYSITGELNMIYIHDRLLLVSTIYPKIITISIGLYTIGLGVKSAMFPLHGWLPDAHANAPASSSSILSSLVLKAYVVVLIKIILRVYGLEIVNTTIILKVIMILGTCGMIYGSLLALRQSNLKRVIAYSSVAQMGYIFLGIGLGSKMGIALAIFHIIGHAVTKSSLFLCTGYLIEMTGKKKLEDLKGVGKEMPFTLSIFTIASLSMVGIPILPGFVSKWYLTLESIKLNYFVLVIFILISSLLNAAYYFPITINGFFGEEHLENKIYKGKSKKINELLPVIVLIVSMVFIGVYSKNIINFVFYSL